MSHRIYITGSGIAPEAEELLAREDCVFQTGNPTHTAADIAGELERFDPDGIIVRQGRITGDVQRAARNLKVISKHGVGVDNIDIPAATARNIPVMITPRANYESTAEHALALILALARKIPWHDARIRSGIFDKKGYDGLELHGKTIGVIGFGKIGRRLSDLLAPFGVRVLAYHPSKSSEDLPPHITKASEIGDIFSAADIISLHCPLSEDTEYLINEQSIAKMKESVLIVNTSRGKIINERDLEEALRSGRIRGAALDVFEDEPPDASRPLFQLDSVVLTTHIAGISDNSFKNMGIGAVENALSVLRGAPWDMECLINKELLDTRSI